MNHDLTEETTVKFYISIGMQGSQEESVSLGELGFTNEELLSITEEDLHNQLTQMQEEWTWNYLDTGWYFD